MIQDEKPQDIEEKEIGRGMGINAMVIAISAAAGNDFPTLLSAKHVGA